MHISQLRLVGFRIYQQLAVDLLPGVNLVLGANGAGKTSLLEAIATLALTRSPRSGSMAEAASWGRDDMGVSATLVDGAASTVVEFRASRPAGQERWARRLSRDGHPVAPRQALGTLGVVLFWPEDLGLVKGGPEPRRRLLDVVLSQLSPRYAEELGRYRRALEHRNAVLRGVRDGSLPASELTVWDDALVGHGAQVMEERRNYLRAADPIVAEAARGIGEVEEARLRYRPGLAPGQEAGDFEADLREGLRSSRAEEVSRAQSLVGPHRDDFEVLLGGHQARQFASQGQQRSLVLALKVAEVRRHREVRGQAPVLLLDDVLSELDLDHRRGLVGLLARDLRVEQTLITATEEHGLGESVPLAQVLAAEAGVIRALGRP